MSRSHNKLLLAFRTFPSTSSFHPNHSPRLHCNASKSRNHRSRHRSGNNGIYFGCSNCVFASAVVLYASYWGGGMAELGTREEMVGTSFMYWICGGVDGD